jgi:hydroxypyruvate isomerase
MRYSVSGNGREQSAFSRRTLLGGMAGAAAFGAVWPLGGLASATERKGRIKQSACFMCYKAYLARHNISFDQFAAACARMGLRSIEQTDPSQWPTLKKHGLICAMSTHHCGPKGLNRIKNHDECLAKLRQSIDVTSAAGFPNVITMSGFREGMDDEEGLANCVIALKALAPYAERKRVTVCLELLNSVHDHKDYMADSTKWCVELVHRVGSPRVKVLYDIYHAGMMKEDVLADIQHHSDCWAHYHTGGVPGRHEIDHTQTLDYAKLMRAIVATGFSGYVGQEFNPARPDALKSLEQAVTLCDV